MKNPLPIALGASLLLNLAFASSQDAAPVQDKTAWLDFDGVALIINNDIVTLRELNSLLAKAKQRRAATTDQESRALLEAITEDKIITQLQSQAGSEMGIAEEDINRTIDRYLAEQRRGKSAEETEQWLASSGAEDLGQMRQNVSGELYRSFWIENQRGNGAGGSRPSRDRYVRPGQLSEAYVVNKDALGDPTTFRLQFLVLANNAWGDAETARDALLGFRAEIEAGADMGALVDEYGAVLRETRGISNWIPLKGIEDEQIRVFCERSEAGALSEVLELQGPDKDTQGFQLVRIAARIEGQPAPPFRDGPTQSSLAERLQRGWDNMRVTRGSDKLWRSAFIRLPSKLQILPPWVRRQEQSSAEVAH